MKYIINFIFFFFLSTTLISNDNKIIDGQLHEIKPKKGDGIYTILARYELQNQPIYQEAFIRLNNIDNNSTLYIHQHYKLPVFLYNYDGSSIRSTIGIDDWDKAVRIKEYNEKLLEKRVRSTHYSKSKILWVPFAEINDEKPASPAFAEPIKKESVKKSIPTTSKPTKLEYGIYGSKYASLEIVDHSLKNKVFYIVSGHGGPDPGAVCTDCTSRLCEDEYAYDVSLRLARNLMQHGAIVEIVIQDKNDGIRDSRILKCDSDEKLANGSKIPIDHLKRLQQRTSYINNKFKEYRTQGVKDQVVVSVHVDSNNKSHKQDVFFCYYKKSESSRALANKLKEKFEEKYSIHQKNREYKGYLVQRNLYVLKNTAPPAVLIELANIKNKFNHKRILNMENRQALANWIYEGLVEEDGQFATSSR